MNYSKVVAILNITDYAIISNDINKLNVPGVTVSMVKGFGDYINEFHLHGFSDNMKIEIYTTEVQAEEIATALSSLADELTVGGGVVAIESVTKLFNVKKLNT